MLNIYLRVPSERKFRVTYIKIVLVKNENLITYDRPEWLVLYT